MGWAKRKYDRIFRGGSLQFEIETATETFTQRQSPRAIQATAEWRVNDYMRAAVLIKETLRHDLLLGRHHAERNLCHREVFDDLLGGGVTYANFVRQPLHAGPAKVLVAQT